MKLRRLRATLAVTTTLTSIALADVQPAVALSPTPPGGAIYVILPGATATAATVAVQMPSGTPIAVGVLNPTTGTFMPSGPTAEQARAVAAKAKALQATNAFSEIASAGTQATARATLNVGTTSGTVAAGNDSRAIGTAQPDTPTGSIFMLPSDPGVTSGNAYNAIVSTGAVPGTASLKRSTIFGSQNLIQPQGIDRLEVFGDLSARYTRYIERSTLIGSTSGQWLGSNNPAADNHEWWTNAGGYTPGQAGWNYNGFETADPGIGAKIAAFNGWATSSADQGRDVGVGRDTLNAAVWAQYATAVGYRACASAYVVSYVTCLGSDAFRNGVLLTQSDAVGAEAAPNWMEGTRNSVQGYQVAQNVVTGSGNTVLGSYAGSNFTALNNAVLLGYGAGNGITAGGNTLTNLDNALVLGLTGKPLITGTFANLYAGVNVPPSNLAAPLHVAPSMGQSSVSAPHPYAATEILENTTGRAGLTVRSAASSTASLFFANPTTANIAGLVWNDAVGALTIRAARGDRLTLNGTALTSTVPVVLPAAPTASLQAATKGYVDAAPGIWHVIGASGVPASVTNSTAETALATVTVPAGTLGPNGVLKVTTNWSHTSNTNAKNLRVRFGGTSGAQYLNLAVTTALARSSALTQFQNRGGLASQIGLTNSGSNTPYSQSATAQATSTVDTSAAQSIVITAQLGTSTDTAALESYVIEAVYMP